MICTNVLHYCNKRRPQIFIPHVFKVAAESFFLCSKLFRRCFHLATKLVSTLSSADMSKEAGCLIPTTLKQTVSEKRMVSPFQHIMQKDTQRRSLSPISLLLFLVTAALWFNMNRGKYIGQERTGEARSATFSGHSSCDPYWQPGSLDLSQNHAEWRPFTEDARCQPQDYMSAIRSRIVTEELATLFQGKTIVSFGDSIDLSLIHI